MRNAVTAARSSWWAQALQNRLIALVLAMVVIVPLIASPADSRLAGSAALVLEGFAIVLMVALLWNARWNFSRERVRTFLSTGANLPVLLFLALALVSCALSPQKVFSIQETLKLGAGVLLYFVVAYQFRQSKHLFLLVDTLIFLAISMSLIAMAMYQVTGAEKAMGLLGNSQILGSILMILLPIVAVVAMTEKAPKRQMAAQFATVVTIGCLLLAHTRSAWAGAAAGLAVLGVLAAVTAVKQSGGSLAAQKHKIVLPGMLAVVAAGFFMLVSTQNSAVVERASLSGVANDPSLQVRQQQWAGTVEMIKASPLTGHHIGLYPVYQNKYTAQGTEIGPGAAGVSLSEQAHNFYLQTAAELGLPGLLLMVGVLVSFLVAGLGRVGQMDAGIRRTLLMGSMASIAAFAVDAVSSPSWQLGQTSMFFWLMLGIGVSCLRPRAQHQEEEAPALAVSPNLTRAFSFGFAAVALMAVLPTFSVSAADQYKEQRKECKDACKAKRKEAKASCKVAMNACDADSNKERCKAQFKYCKDTSKFDFSICKIECKEMYPK